MIPRDRCLTALDHREPDRVPMNYHADSGFSAKLKTHFGIEGSENRACLLTGNEDPRLLAALDCDLRTLVPEYVGPDREEYADGAFQAILGEHMLIIENPDGSAYFTYPELPLAEAKTVADIDAHPWPTADWFDFSSIPDQIDEFEEYCIIAGDMGTGDCMNRCLCLFGYERVMLGMVERDPALLRAFERIADFYYEYMKRLIEAGRGRVDVAYYGEDMGVQNGPRVGVELCRELIFPEWERHFALAKKHGCKVMMHSCGSARALYPDLIRCGVDIHDTVQPYAAGMDPVGLKRDFGDRMSFHGAVSIQQVLQTGTTEEVAAEVRRIIDALAPDGGYILAPTHWIQGGTPVENAVTMYETAKEYSAEFYRRRRA